MRTSKVLPAVILIAGLVSYCLKISAYDNFVIHPSLTEAAIALYNRQAAAPISAEQSVWIRDGSIAEDTDPRYLNHYYDPSTGQGLNDGGHSGLSAKAWARNQSNWTAFAGDYSESAILDNYRQGNDQRAWRGVGQILHLIQDMSVPAHTRNDAHAEGDPYEAWAERYGRVNLDKCSQINVANLDQAFDELASYSHYNFFSKDTIHVDDYKKYGIAKKIENGIEVEFLVSNEFNHKLVVIDRSGLLPIYKINDFYVHLDYWNLLHPKAIGYSAGVLDYFARQFAQIDQEKAAAGSLSKLWAGLKNSKYQPQYLLGDAFFSLRTEISGWFWQTVDNVGNTAKYWGIIDYESDHRAPVNQAINAGLEQAAGAIQGAQEAKEEISQTAETAARQAKEQADKAKDKSEEIIAQGQEAAQSALDSAQRELASAAEQARQSAQTLSDDIEKTAKENLAKAKEKLENLLPSDQAKTGENGNGQALELVESKPSNPAKYLFVPGVEIIDSPADPIEYNPTLDTIISLAPPSLASSSQARFEFQSVPAGLSFQCQHCQGGQESAWLDCQNQTIVAVADGENTLFVRAQNDSGQDLSPAEYSWTVDTAPPAISILGAPDLYSSSSAISLNFDSAGEADISYTCRFDQGETFFCGASGNISNLTAGWHELTVSAADQAGNTASTAIAWLTDADPPQCLFVNPEGEYYDGLILISWECGDGDESNTSGLFSQELKIGINEEENWQFTENWEIAADDDWLFDPRLEEDQYGEILSGMTGAKRFFLEFYLDALRENNPPVNKLFLAVQVRDQAGNLSGWATNTIDISEDNSRHLLISAFKTKGTKADDEWVEIYNPTEDSINLDHYRLRRKSQTGENEYPLVSDFPDVDLLPGQYYLIAHPTKASINRPPDAVYSSADYGLADNNTLILYENNEIIDQVGYGAAQQAEGAAYPANPGVSSGLIRKANSYSNSASLVRGRYQNHNGGISWRGGGADEWQGNAYDTDDNSQDFLLIDWLNPRNRQSPAEPAEGTPLIPEGISDLNINYDYQNTNQTRFAWSASFNNNLAAGAQYEIKYWEKTSATCYLGLNWDSAWSVPNLPTPAAAAGEDYSVLLAELAGEGNEHCFGIRVYNGLYWSEIGIWVRGSLF